MKTVLCLSDSTDDLFKFVKNANLLFFQIEQVDPEEHKFTFFQEIYTKLKGSTDLSKVDLIIADYVESIPLVYFMRKEGHFCPVIFIPHSNPYPLNLLFYFLLMSQFPHPDDVVLCGSMQAVKGYSHLVKMKALPICTFGIKSAYEKSNKQHAREILGLPANKKILLYTGRFMNDKGLIPLLDAYDIIKERIKNTVLVMSVNHIDPAYFNMLAGRLENVILFYRLEKEKMIPLYQSANLFVSAATSIFETYGKSPLEAIACGVPAVVPRWDGFPYFINDRNGSLAKVIYSEEGIDDAPYSFAVVDEADFADKCCEWLSKDKIEVDSNLPYWAYYEETMVVLSKMVQEMLSTKKRFYEKINPKKKLELSSYSPAVQKVCSHYELKTCEDLEIKAETLGLINRENPGDLGLLKELHDELFKTMDASSESILASSCALST